MIQKIQKGQEVRPTVYNKINEIIDFLNHNMTLISGKGISITNSVGGKVISANGLQKVAEKHTPHYYDVQLTSDSVIVANNLNGEGISGATISLTGLTSESYDLMYSFYTQEPNNSGHTQQDGYYFVKSTLNDLSHLQNIKGYDTVKIAKLSLNGGTAYTAQPIETYHQPFERRSDWFLQLRGYTMNRITEENLTYNNFMIAFPYGKIFTGGTSSLSVSETWINLPTSTSYLYINWHTQNSGTAWYSVENTEKEWCYKGGTHSQLIGIVKTDTLAPTEDKPPRWSATGTLDIQGTGIVLSGGTSLYCQPLATADSVLGIKGGTLHWYPVGTC